MNQHCRHVDKFGGDVYIQLAELLDIREILGRDLGDRDVVDVDVLLADQIQQQVERTFINAGDSDRKREVVGFVLRCSALLDC